MANVEIVGPKEDWRVVIHQTLRISDDLNFEFRRQAPLVGRAGFFNAQAKRKVRKLKTELEVLSARLRKRIKRTNGSLTVDAMRAAVHRKKSYQRKLNELEEAQYEEDLIQGLLKALDHKKECLVQISANSRKEMPEELRSVIDDLRGRARRKKWL